MYYFLFLFGFEQWFTEMLEKCGLSGDAVFYFKAVVYIFILVLLSALANWIAKNVILVFVWKFTFKTKNQLVRFLVEKKVFRRLSHLAPVIIIYTLGPVMLADYPNLANLTYLITHIYLIVVGWLVIYAFTNAAVAMYDTFEIAKTRPIKIYVQVFKILVGVVAGITIISVLLGISPVFLLTSLGAMTAILLLVFRDTILGFVGGLQVTANDLVQVDDWIEMPKYGADGDVIDITLHTVLVQNWDRTISVIPSYALVSEGFKNWRGMIRSGGRRIMRSVYIDMKSIRFCDKDMLDKFEEVYYLKDYIKTKREEIDAYNKEHNFDESVPINGRHMTNLGTFRAYVTNYLSDHPLVKKDMLYMVRQLQPNEKGLPLEIYCFTNSVKWPVYEKIQADIFDHIFSVISFFDLKIFQYPSELNVNVSDKSSNAGKDETGMDEDI